MESIEGVRIRGSKTAEKCGTEDGESDGEEVFRDENQTLQNGRYGQVNCGKAYRNLQVDVHSCNRRGKERDGC